MGKGAGFAVTQPFEGMGLYIHFARIALGRG